MGRRVIRDMAGPRRREETATIAGRAIALAVAWEATPEAWTASVQVTEGDAPAAALPVRTTIDLAAAGEALLFSAVTLQDLKRLAEDALLRLARAYIERRYGAESGAAGAVER